MSFCSKLLLQNAAEEVNYTANLLSKQVDLSPNNVVTNQLLSRLVESLSQWSLRPELQPLPSLDTVQSALDMLPKLCGKAECEMEKWWARQLVNSSENIWKAIDEFWYINQYRVLVNAEYELIHPLRVNSLAFLGSGALPLTALLFAEKFAKLGIKLKIICVDSDPEACDFSQYLIRRLEMDEAVTVLNMSADNYEPRKDCLVVCASLLKTQNLYQHLFDRGIKHILVRDVEGVYRFLYQTAPYPKSEFYTEISRTSFCRERINISRLFKKMEMI